MRVLCEAIPVHVWTATPDGELDFVADRVARDFDVPAERLLGSGWVSAVHPDDLAAAAEAWATALRTGEPYEVEFRVFSGVTREYRWHLVRALPFRDQSGRIVRWYGTNTDIEVQKRAEAARDAARAEAEHANRVKSQFLAMMSHELRTPLNAIGGFAKLMLDGIPTPPTEGQQNYLRRIVKGQEHLLGLIDAVLTHAKLEAGRMTYRMTNIRMGELLESVEAMVAPQLAARGIAYDCDGCDGSLVLRGDRQKVVQILLNLLSNAVKFTPAQGCIMVRTSVPAPGRAAIAVRDTGVGMTAQQIATVFEPYVQFDNRLSREAKGTGLGMPISRELARGMGGDLTVVSEPGVGTEFELTLAVDESAGGGR
jgi:PAS domain S-box-containing protein